MCREGDGMQPEQRAVGPDASHHDDGGKQGEGEERGGGGRRWTSLIQCFQEIMAATDELTHHPSPELSTTAE